MKGMERFHHNPAIYVQYNQIHMACFLYIISDNR